MASKVYHLATNGRHWTPLGVDGAAVSNRFTLYSVLLGCGQEANEVCLCENGIGQRCGIVGLLSNEELDVPEPERVVGGIGASFARAGGGGRRQPRQGH